MRRRLHLQRATKGRFADRDRAPKFDSPETAEIARRLIATRDPAGAFADLLSFEMRVELSGRVFERFMEDPALYRGRAFRVTNYPRLQTSVWHDFPTRDKAVLYTVIPDREAVERLVFVTVGEGGQVSIDRVIGEPLDGLRRKYKEGGLRQKLKVLEDLGGRRTRRKRRELKQLADDARTVDRSLVGSLLGLSFSPRRGRVAYWEPGDVFAFFGQAFSVYNWFPNSLASRHGVERVELVRKRLLAGDRGKRLALDVTFPPWVRINPGKGGTMRFFLHEAPDGSLTSDVLHYDLRFMAGGDKLLRAHHEMQGYQPAEEGRGLLYPGRRWIRFRFKGEREGVSFDGFVEDDAPTGVDSYFTLRARFAGAERDNLDELVAGIQAGTVDLRPGVRALAAP